MFPSSLTAILFAVSMVCAGRSTRMIGGAYANFFRLMVAMICLAAYGHLLGQGWLGKGFSYFLVGGAIGIGVGDFATFQALQRIPPRLTSLLVQCLCAPFAALVEWIWLGTTLTPGQLLGGGIILVGTSLSLLPGVRIGEARGLLVVGALLATFSALAQAIGAVLTRKAIEVNTAVGVTIDGMTAAYQRMCGAFLIMLLTYAAIDFTRRRRQRRNPGPVVSKPWRKAAPWIVSNALAGLVFGIACFQWALMSMPAAVVLSIVALSPLIVMPIAWLVDGDRPPPLAIIGGVIAVGGVIVLQWF
ncbi:MAG TPA: DMT family transporter [Chthoniobacteraceae bacterium]|nr:DMT family transporter [Chthoniobacteraceae bacterium]